MAPLSKLNLLQTLIPFLFSLLLLPDKLLSQSFAFDTFDPNPTDLIYQGDASVPSGSTSLRLTRTDNSGNALQRSVGRVLYSEPVLFWTPPRPGFQASFITTIRFLITSGSNNPNPADGIAFFIAPVNTTLGAGGGSFGVFDSCGRGPSTFAVEFDIYPNEYDPRYAHIGIDIESVNSTTTTRFDGLVGNVVTAHIIYSSELKIVNVFVTSGGERATLSSAVDLKTVLPQRVQVGISASTGLEMAVHDVVSWNFTSGLSFDPFSRDGGDDGKMYIRQYA